MAHRCWVCEAVCHCGGDIDDTIHDEHVGCTHYRTCDPDGEGTHMVRPAPGMILGADGTAATERAT